MHKFAELCIKKIFLKHTSESKVGRTNPCLGRREVAGLFLSVQLDQHQHFQLAGGGTHPPPPSLLRVPPGLQVVAVRVCQRRVELRQFSVGAQFREAHLQEHHPWGRSALGGWEAGACALRQIANFRWQLQIGTWEIHSPRRNLNC